MGDYELSKEEEEEEGEEEEEEEKEEEKSVLKTGGDLHHRSKQSQLFNKTRKLGVIPDEWKLTSSQCLRRETESMWKCKKMLAFFLHSLMPGCNFLSSPIRDSSLL